MVPPLAVAVEPGRGDQGPGAGAKAAVAEMQLAKLEDDLVAGAQRLLAQPGGQCRAVPPGSILEHDGRHGAIVLGQRSAGPEAAGELGEVIKI